MRYVLDVSAAVALLNGEPSSAYWSERLGNAELVAAPDLFIAEISNVYWKYTRFASLPVELARASVHTGIAMIQQWAASAELYEAAFNLATQMGHAAYDCFYLVLAQRLDASLLTADRKRAERAHALGIALA